MCQTAHAAPPELVVLDEHYIRFAWQSLATWTSPPHLKHSLLGCLTYGLSPAACPIGQCTLFSVVFFLAFLSAHAAQL